LSSVFAGQWDDALVLIRRCGERALSTFSWRLAVDLFSKAEMACERSGANEEELLSVLRCAGEACEHLEAWEEAGKRYARQLAGRYVDWV
jgi:hypothetical protein